MVSTFWNLAKIQFPQLLNLLERSLNPICVYSDQGQALYWSQSFLKLLQPATTAIDFIADFVAMDVSRATLEKVWQNALQGQMMHFRTQPKALGESVEWCVQFDVLTNLILLTAEPAENTNQQQLTADYERAIAALIRTEQKWKTLILHSSYLFIQVNSNAQIIYASPAVETLLGYHQEELLGQPITELVHAHQASTLALSLQLWRHRIKTGTAGMECWWRTKSGKWICLSIHGQPMPPTLNMDGVIISGYDVTDRKALEAELQATEARFQALVRNIPGAVFRCDPSYRMTFTSHGIEQITGYPAATFLYNQGQSYLSIIHPDDMTMIKDSLIQCVMDRYHSAIEYRVIHANGCIRWVSERKQGVFDQNGNLLWLDGVLMDISASKRLAQVP